MVQFTYKGLFWIVVMMQIGYTAPQMQAPIPARFVEGEQSLQNLIVFPDVAGDVNFNVYCVANISDVGHIERNYCFASDQVDEAFRNAVITAGESTKVTPAIMSGEAQPVHIWYRVVFIRNGNATAVGVYSNWGRDVARFGNKYEGPQRIRNTAYPSACHLGVVRNVSSIELVKSNDRPLAFFVLTSVTIDASGTPGNDVAFDWGERRLHGPCPARIKHILEHTKYIPAHHGGQPVEATYLEPWGNYEAMQLH